MQRGLQHGENHTHETEIHSQTVGPIMGDLFLDSTNTYRSTLSAACFMSIHLLCAYAFLNAVHVRLCGHEICLDMYNSQFSDHNKAKNTARLLILCKNEATSEATFEQMCKRDERSMTN